MVWDVLTLLKNLENFSGGHAVFACIKHALCLGVRLGGRASLQIVPFGFDIDAILLKVPSNLLAPLKY